MQKSVLLGKCDPRGYQPVTAATLHVGHNQGFPLFEIAEQSQGSYLMNDPSHKNVRVSTLWVEQAGSQLECQYAPVGPPDRAPRDVSVQRVFQHSFDNALTQHSSKLSGLETPSMQKYVCFGTIFTQKRFVEIYRLT